MKIRDVMTPNPRTVSPNDTVQSAAQVMRAEDESLCQSWIDNWKDLAEFRNRPGSYIRRSPRNNGGITVEGAGGFRSGR